MAHFAAWPDDDEELYQVRTASRRASSSAWSLRILTTCLLIAGLLAVGDFMLSWSSALGSPGGRVTDPTPISITVGGQRLAIPSNMLRFANQRTPEAQERVELAVHWPSLEGYAPALREAFLDEGPNAPVLFLSIRTRQTATDSAGRLASVYRHFLDDTPLEAPAGLVGRHLTQESGLAGEEVFFEAGSTDPFTAHCLAADAGVPAICLTEVHAGQSLSVQVRFRKGLLADWADIKSATRLLLLRLGVTA
jgi:hypothetical protein